MIRRLVWLGMWLLVARGLFAGGEVTLSGEGAQAWAGSRFPVITYGDYITRTPDTLAYLEVREDGTFRVTFPVEETLEVHLFPGIYDLYLFVRPAGRYRLSLPPRKDKTLHDLLNPYFRPEVHPWLPQNVPAGDLNYLILRLEDMYNPLFYRHASLMAVHRKDTLLPVQLQALRDTFAGVEDPFFRDWLEARIALLETMGMPRREEVLDRYRTFALRVRLRNRAYMELFNQVFENYFNYLTRHRHAARLDTVVAHGDADSLRLLIRDDLRIAGDGLVDLVGLKGIYDAWYNRTYEEEELWRLLQHFAATVIPSLRPVARNVVRRLGLLRRGSPAPLFTLPDIAGKPVALQDLRGKYVLLNFSSRLSYSSLRQFPLLGELLDKYGDVLQVVTVAVDNDPAQLRAFVEEKGYRWPFLVCGMECNVARTYRVKGYPVYYLLDPQGRVVLAPAPAPTENFEAEFRKILKEKGLRKAEASPPAAHQ